MSVDEADFVYLREKTNATAGNLSMQIDKLTNAGYIEANRVLDGKKTRTRCKMTDVGRKAFEKYVKALKSYLVINKKTK